MKYLFDYRREIKEKLSSNQKIILLMDYDGTLTPIVKRPELAVLDQETREIIKNLSKNRRFRVGVISGRTLRDVKRLVGLKNLYYAGNHGLEASGPGFHYIHPGMEETVYVMRAVAYKLNNSAKCLKGIVVENKVYSVSFHYRMMSPSKRRQAIRLFMDAVRPYLRGRGFRVFKNKMVLELMPDAGFGKGDIAIRIVDAASGGGKGVGVVYVGDDNTDEDAFKALRKAGITVVVGRRKSKAMYYLKDVGDVLKMLKLLNSGITGAIN